MQVLLPFVQLDADVVVLHAAERAALARVETVIGEILAARRADPPVSGDFLGRIAARWDDVWTAIVGTVT